jgi:YVTN family beta-propeller protein
MNTKRSRIPRGGLLLAVLTFGLSLSSRGQVLPNTGQEITPLAPSGAQFGPLNPGLSDNAQYVAGQAVSSVVSPDGKTLLILTSGYNLVRAASGANEGSVVPGDSTQFVFVEDISQRYPVQRQTIQIQNTYNGIVFDPSGTAFYVTGGVDDNVHIYVLGQNGLWTEQGSPIGLGHTAGTGLSVKPQAAGIAITNDGSKLVVANYYNDSISILTKTMNGWAVTAELDLRPGKINPEDSGVPGGEYPFWVVVKGNHAAYVSSIRDREIVAVSLDSPAVAARIAVPGQPNKMVLNASQSKLYVAQDNSDSVAVIDTNANALEGDIPVTAPRGLLPDKESRFKGNDTNSVTLSKDERWLYVTNGWMNDVAVVDLDEAMLESRVVGLIPAGWYPNAVSLSKNGRFMYVVNGKSPTGANPNYCHGLNAQQSAQCNGSNQYDLQLIKAGLQSFPTPAEDGLSRLTEQVADNNHFGRKLSDEDAEKLEFLRSRIHHVIYIIKENRTYDQVLGDLEVGNGDPAIVQFGNAVTPNLHNLARQFVDLDNFYDTSEVSMDGWPWSTSAHATDVVERQTSVEYAGRGLSYDSEGTNRNVNIGYATLAQRLQANPLTPDDPDVLPGAANAAAPDGPQHQQGTGFLWDAALRAGLTLRNYGFFIDQARYNLTAYPQYNIPEDPSPAASNTVVAYATSQVLRPYTDPFFRGFDMTFPDFYRFKEWEREFDAKYANGELPNLTLLRLPHDHTGNFGTAIAGVNTPELQEADNDFAVGLVVQKIASSRYKDDTLIFVIEDDAQDGGDHVDAHRSIAFVVGPYVKHGAVVSTPHTTLSMYRTIEDILGLGHSNLNDALAVPMTDVFDVQEKNWTFAAIPSDYLYGTQLPLPPLAAGHHILYSTHNAVYWAKVTEGMDFSAEDRVNDEQFNRIMWKGLMGARPYPAFRSGLDLRANRQELLKRYRSNLQEKPDRPMESPAQGAGDGE